MKRKHEWGNKYSKAVRYGNWVCIIVDTGAAEWVWWPA